MTGPKSQEITKRREKYVGRTGKFFTIENWDIEPNIIFLAKFLAVALPLSVVIAKKEITDEQLDEALDVLEKAVAEV